MSGGANARGAIWHIDMSRYLGSNMIYRILVDDRMHTRRIKYLPKPERRFVVTEGVLDVLASGSAVEREVAKLLAPLKDMAFAEKGAFIAVMLRTLGQDQLALLEQRLLSLTFTTTTYIEDKWVAYPFNKRTDRDYQDDTRLGGAGYGRLADIMQDSGLRAPAISNPRARFYFTELGWLTVGRHVAAEARRLGHVV
jgi:hypothetical protein